MRLQNTSVYSHHDISTELLKSFSEGMIQVLPDAGNFGIGQFEMNNFLERTTNFTLLEIKGNDTKVAEEYCWAITHAAKWSYCGGSDFSVLQFGFQLHSFVYTDIGVFFCVIKNNQMHLSFLINFNNLSSTCFEWSNYSSLGGSYCTGNKWYLQCIYVHYIINS